MSRYSADIVIIGGGIMGAAIFHYAVKTLRKRVVLLEKKAFASGATGSSGGLIRVTHSTPALSELALHSLSEFQQFEKITGQSCDFIKTGFFLVDKREKQSMLEQGLKPLLAQGLKVKFLSVQQVKKNFAHLNLPMAEEDIAIYEPEAGYANPAKAALAYISAGIQSGGIAYEHVNVTEILTNNTSVKGVQTDRGMFEAACIVVSAGVASKKLLSPLGIDTHEFTAKNIQIAFYAYPSGIKPVASFLNKSLGLYGRHDAPDACLLGTTRLQEVHSVNEEGKFCLEINDHIKSLAISDFPWLQHAFYRGYRCAADAYTANQLGVAKFLDAPKGLFLCSGWSGVGFKLAPECAKRVVKQLQAVK